MEYNFTEIERKWRQYWSDRQVYKVSNTSDKPKCYILDMFPYPSGAGLHVGHPLGYIASDIYARYKRLKGYNVLHPMGFDAFGLPAEQYAIETGQHPAVTTEKNIARYREQLDNIGFSYDWDRAVRTSEPNYYKWTQWIFLQLFHSWYNRAEDTAKPITELVALFEQEGNASQPCPGDEDIHFDGDAWKNYSEKEQREILMQYRLAYQGFAQVWWCEALGTVLANDEVVNGVSERGGHPVERKNMRQWFLRITEYAERLLKSLDTLDWSEAMKEMQRNWIGKSVGAEVKFSLTPALSKGEGVLPNAVPSSDENTLGWQTADASVYDKISPFQNELKNNLTEAENMLWQCVSNNKLGVKIRRQHIAGRYVADFICLPYKLIIEIDGKIHERQQDADAARTQYLEEKGFRVIRFSNEDVISDINNVIEKIKGQLAAASISPGPPGSEIEGESPLSFGEGWGEAITVFTTRPDTIFGVDFMVLAPEHELVNVITTPTQKQAIETYQTYVKSRSERERMSEVKQVTGCFTGAYASHPFTGRQIPVWISEYVLAGYGTGAIMAVPSGDDRDHAFAKHFDIPITNIFGARYTGEKAYSDKNGTIENSDFLSGLNISDATEAAINKLVSMGSGIRKVNYRLRDAGFSRQRYWGEPFPVIYVDNIPYGTDEHIISNNKSLGHLPVELPMVEHYKPGPEGQGPLANIEDWVETEAGERETNTMPGYAGSSWYFLRYMDPHNDNEFASRKATDYWNQVDLYIGGTEHAVGHLLYSRMWTKALCDLGYIGFDEPFKKLLNQGMIQGVSQIIWRYRGEKGSYDTRINFMPIKVTLKSGGAAQLDFKHLQAVFYSDDFLKANEQLREQFDPIHIPIQLANGNFVNIEKLIRYSTKYLGAYVTATGVFDYGEWISFEEDFKEKHNFFSSSVPEKMSKSKLNVVNPDDIVAQYGADTFRMYEMFLGPIDVSKPWDTKGIEGVHRFIKKLWRLYNDEQTGTVITDETPTDTELRLLHKTIKKIGEDIERFSFNTSVSQFMICVNELTALNCHKRGILEPLAITICAFAPHIAEELWHQLGHEDSVIDAAFPQFEERYTVDNNKQYPVAINGKTKMEMEFHLDTDPALIEQEVLADANVQKWMEGKPVKKFIYVRGKMINVVV